MQALGLVRISKKQNFLEISATKFPECKKRGLGRILYLVNFIYFFLNFLFLLFECFRYSIGCGDGWPSKLRQGKQ